jgi:glycosyltransferase involved in cell wall biosynthesis
MTSVTAGDVSVVIPTYNRAGLLDQTLRSIEGQTLRPAETIVVDDASTDSTQAVLAERAVTVVTNRGASWGPARARNAGLERVSTEFVAFVDSDDLLMPRALEQLQAALLERPEAPFAYGQGLAVVKADGGWLHHGVIGASPEERLDPLVSIFVRNSVPSSGALVRSSVIQRLGGYDPAVVWSEDHHLWIRLAQLGPPAHVDDVVCAYRRHSGNRYDPVDVGVDTPAIFALADNDTRLRGHMSDRVGVILCETFADAIASRRPRAFMHAVRGLLPRARRPGRVVARAVAHFRTRRASARLGDAVWRERGDIRDWLAGF